MELPVKTILGVADPLRRAREAGELAALYQAAITELSRIRREALEELIAQGMSQAQIAGKLGVTRTRIGQLLSTGPRAERAFLGSGTLTVAVGGKLEARATTPGPIVAEEDFQAYEALQALARTMQLETDYEVIRPPGMIDLNRDNLIVVCGPRLSPLIAQVLASDYHLGFEQDESGWYLVDRTEKTTYRSPMDHGEPSDYAYFGRLPRLDGRGNFLYIAGIHSVGAAGAVHYLDHHLTELYREVKTRRFSMIIRCNFDAATRKIESSKRVSPLHKTEGN
ncbi:MAG: sigma-70 family RNA polymerase sigma factor [Pseudonocardiaceae bacterium]